MSASTSRKSQAIAELGARSVRETALESAYEACAQQLFEEDEAFKAATKDRRHARADRR